MHQSTAFPDRAAAVFWLQRWPAPTEMNEVANRAWDEIEDAGGALCGQPMNESPEVPIIAVVDDDESVRESLAGLAEFIVIRWRA